MSLRVPFGLKESTLYEPNGVPNGKACGCICPACKRPLIARQGAATPHFAHAPGEDCARGFETAVHLAAKQIIAERKEVRLPIVEYQSTLQYAPSKVHTAERLLRLDEVELEVWMSNIRPDIWVKARDERYLVEIAVTHFVDETKASKIRQIQIPAFEVDVQSLKNTFTFAALENLLFSSAPYPAKWIFNKHANDMEVEAIQIHLQEKQRVDEQYALAQIAHRNAEKQRRDREFEQEQKRSEKFHRYRVMPPHEKLERNIRELGLSYAQIHKFSISVPLGNSFKVSLEIWQSGVLVFIAKTEAQRWNNHQSYDIQFQECLAWMRRSFNVHAPVPDGDSVAVWKYLKHLETLGILKYLWKRKFALKIRNRDWPKIFPPTEH